MENYELCLQTVEALMKGIDLNEKSAELPTRQLMHHLLMARVMYESMSAEERAAVDVWQDRTKKVRVVKCVLKEKKERGKKKVFPPDPLSKENKKKEKQRTFKKNVCDADSDEESFFKARKEMFWKECEKYAGQYDIKELTNFFKYWSEKAQDKFLMRWELEPTWETGNRLEFWKGSSFTSENKAAEIRLERTKGKATQQERDAQQQQIAAQARRQQEERERQKNAETKANSISIEEYIKQNPDSMMAKMYRESHKNDK